MPSEVLSAELEAEVVVQIVLQAVAEVVVEMVADIRRWLCNSAWRQHARWHFTKEEEGGSLPVQITVGYRLRDYSHDIWYSLTYRNVV